MRETRFWRLRSRSVDRSRSAAGPPVASARATRLVVAVAAALVCVVALALVPARARAAASAEDSCPWIGSSASADARAQEVLAQMTVDEKVSMLGLARSPEGYENHVPAVPRLCIPQFTLQDGPAGVAA